jgi:hypothetical protein
LVTCVAGRLKPAIGSRFKTIHSYLRVNESGFFSNNGLGVALFGVTPPFVKIVSVSMGVSFGIMRFSNTLFVELPLLMSMAKSHRRMQKCERFSGTN